MIEQLKQRVHFTLFNKMGRRGAVLLFFALIFTMFGMKAIFDPTNSGHHLFWEDLIDPRVRVILWLVPSALAVIAAFNKKHNDGYGFSALGIPACLVFLSHTFSWIAWVLGEMTHDPQFVGWSGSWTQALVWLLIMALLHTISGWTEISNEPIRVYEPPMLRKQTVMVLDERPEPEEAD